MSRFGRLRTIQPTRGNILNWAFGFAAGFMAYSLGFGLATRLGGVGGWIVGNLTALAILFIGWLLHKSDLRMQRREEQDRAAAAFRFELEANHLAIVRIVESENFLRDDAFINMKIEGYAARLPNSLRTHVIRHYDNIYQFNEQIGRLRHGRTEQNERDAEQVRDTLSADMTALIAAIDEEYPEIAARFR